MAEAQADGTDQARGARAATPDVFVSYASQDAPLAREAVEVLESEGIRCWIAPRDVTAGAHYADAIIGAISGAKAMVLVLSDSAQASKHVGKEVERAASKGRPIIALRTGTAPLPPAFEYFLSESQWIDVGTAGIAGVAAKLIEAVRSHLGPQSAERPRWVAPARDNPATARRKKWLLASGALALALVAGFLAVQRWRAGPTAVRPTALTVAAGSAAPPAAAPEKSIAVLPFVDMSEKHDQEYFSDGLSEELIDHLAQIPDLKVIARTSAFAFKGKNEDMRTIAGKLGVTNLLEGSVRKSGSKLRITAQLIRATDGAHMWSQTYNRDFSDIFALQEEISTTVANALNAALNVSTSALAQRPKGTSNPEAYKLLLQGNYYFWRGNQGDIPRSVALFSQAVKLDPRYALAWAKLARAYAWQVFTGDLPAPEAAAKSREAIQQALAIDPKCAEAYYARGNVARIFDGDWSAAISDYQRAAALESTGDVGDAAQSNVLILQGEASAQFGEYFEWTARLLERSPLATSAIDNLAGIQQAAGQLGQSAASYRRLLDLNPDYATARANCAITLMLMGRNAEALELAQHEPAESNKLAALACIYWALGRRSESDAALAALERGFADRLQYVIASVHAYRGELDPAFASMERAYQQSKGSLEALKIDPLLQTLHADPRFLPLLRKAKLAA